MSFLFKHPVKTYEIDVLKAEGRRRTPLTQEEKDGLLQASMKKCRARLEGKLAAARSAKAAMVCVAGVVILAPMTIAVQVVRFGGWL